MRYSIGIVVVALLVIVGCGSDKSSGPEPTLSEQILGSWNHDEGDSDLLFLENTSFEQLAKGLDSGDTFIWVGGWRITAGNILIRDFWTEANIKTPLQTSSLPNITLTSYVSITGTKMTLVDVDTQRTSHYTKQ